MRLRFPTILFFTFIMCFSSFPQTNKNDIVVAKFLNHKITIGEFNLAYAKFGAGSGYAPNDSITYLNNFMKLYLKFRLKLQYAKDTNLEDEPSVKNEIQNFKNELIYKYFLDKYVTEPRLFKIFDRRKWELRLSHILISPKPGQIAESENLANAILDSLKNGADFAEMAERYSQDPTSKDNGGDAYYFTAGILPIVIEDAIYNTPVGEIYPHVLKSKFGFQIFKVTEKRERRNKVRGKQLLIKYEFDGKPDTARAQAIIDTVYNKIKAGEDFDKLIEQYSMDEKVSQNHGDLGNVTRSYLLRPLDEALFNIKKVGDYSGIIKTKFGFHIIKLTSIDPEPTFQQAQSEIAKLFSVNQFNDAFDMTIDSLENANNFVLNKEIQNEIDKRILSSKDGFDINLLPDSIKNSTIFSFTGRNVTVANLINIIENLSPEENRKITQLPFNEGVKRIAGRLLILNDSQKLENEIPNYLNRVTDFTDNILVQRIEKKETTDKIVEDSTNLHKYYIENKNKYVWPDRVEFTEIYSTSKPEIEKYQAMIKKGANFDSLCAKYTERLGYKEKAGHWELKDRNFTEMHKRAWEIKKVGSYSSIYPNFKGYSIIRLDKKDPSHTKTYEEALSDIKTDYHNSQTLKFENEFVEMLYKKYNPEIYFDKISEIKN